MLRIFLSGIRILKKKCKTLEEILHRKVQSNTSWAHFLLYTKCSIFFCFWKCTGYCRTYIFSPQIIRHYQSIWVWGWVPNKLYTKRLRYLALLKDKFRFFVQNHRVCKKMLEQNLFEMERTFSINIEFYESSQWFKNISCSVPTKFQ